MGKYTARVSFIVYDFEADSTKDAMEQVSGLVDELVKVDTELTWDDVDYIVQEEN